MPVSLLQLWRIGVIVYEWLDIPWMKDYYNFGFDHFSMTWRKVGIRGLLDYLLGNAGPFASGDWILPDLTIQGSIKLNRHLHTFPQTYYFSYATKHPTKVMGFAVPSGIRGIHPLLFIRVLQMSQWRHPQHVSPPYKGYRFVSITPPLPIYLDRWRYIIVQALFTWVLISQQDFVTPLMKIFWSIETRYCVTVCYALLLCWSLTHRAIFSWQVLVGC